MQKHCFPFLLFLVKIQRSERKVVPQNAFVPESVIFVHPKLKSSFLCAFLFSWAIVFASS